MKILKSLSAITLVILSLIFIQCSDDNVNLTTPVKIRLTDAPAQYDKVNIDIQAIQFHSSNDDTKESGWQEMDLLNAGIYDLLEFNNGLDTLLVDQDMPSGTVSQMRLILGENNSVVIDGVPYVLDTPSAQTSGLKFQIHDDFIAGIEYELWIDFDAARSIVETGNGKYKLKPVIRTFNEATSGVISGSINPAEALPTIHAIIGLDTTSTIAEANGDFMIKGLQSGIYKLDLMPIDGYTEKEIEGIEVNNGAVTDAGTIEILAN
ncbi:DUF4382 domain-containing protein [Labilibaculum antarcticum]|uniref:DUF4382 domain-containing protein n=1 Tax=Labilibaculum antarcticum TaxID=1717717 RepID=A0A1Y1CQE6_9BACT|nr:DUF4382 domain-containing protein [Labilibaculum antarcticum]BAX82689.1 hypothetical protein ALGA_4399 [Labilibaculum antarcticum]